MSRPAWMPTGSEVGKQLVITAILAAIAYAASRYLRRP